MEDLHRLDNLVVALADERRSAHISKVEAEVRGIEGQYEKSAAASRLEELRQIQLVKLEIGQDGESVAGLPKDVLNEVDRRTVGRLEWSFKADKYWREPGELTLTARVRPGLTYEPLTLNIASSDRAWVNSSFASLSAEIDKSVPRWAFMRSIAGRMGAALLVLTGVGLLFLALANRLDWPKSVFSLLFLLGFGVVAGCLSRVYDWFFPPFEITSDGKSSGWPRVAFIGTTALAILSGILVNVISP